MNIFLSLILLLLNFTGCNAFDKLHQGGGPTEDGGYRQKYKGKWYQSKPVDETPKCDCGLDDLMNEVGE